MLFLERPTAEPDYALLHSLSRQKKNPCSSARKFAFYLQELHGSIFTCEKTTFFNKPWGVYIQQNNWQCVAQQLTACICQQKPAWHKPFPFQLHLLFHTICLSAAASSQLHIMEGLEMQCVAGRKSWQKLTVTHAVLWFRAKCLLWYYSNTTETIACPALYSTAQTFVCKMTDDGTHLCERQRTSYVCGGHSQVLQQEMSMNF